MAETTEDFELKISLSVKQCPCTQCLEIGIHSSFRKNNKKKNHGTQPLWVSAQIFKVAKCFQKTTRNLRVTVKSKIPKTSKY